MFHWQNGLYFSRNEDGSVHIEKRESALEGAEVVFSVDIPSSEWASIVGAVSKAGETAATYNSAMLLHAGTGVAQLPLEV